MAWIRDWSVTPAPRVRLLCVPGAGGGIHVNRQWARSLPTEVGVLAVELPGHDSRLRERPVSDLATLLDGPLFAAVEALLDRPLAVFGHSMGAVLAADLCRALRRDRDWRPVLFVAAAAETPDRMRVPYGAEATDEQIVEYLTLMGGAPSEVLADEEYRRIVAGAVRADLTMIANRRPTPPTEPTSFDCPVRVYLGEVDPTLDPGSTDGWKDFGSGDFRTRRFPGDHAFHRTSTSLVIEALLADLDGVMASERSAERST